MDAFPGDASEGQIAATRPATMFETAAAVLRRNLERGLLYPGLVLQESGLSERLGMSRATVKRALEMLEAEGAVSRYSGRGFMVGGTGGTPKRDDLRLIELDLNEMDDSVGKANWELIYEDVEQTLSRSLIFGRYRINEVLMGEEFSVSRTVVRDVLGRLQERGLVQKSPSSRWIVEPLTSQRIKDKFELRSILETAALRLAMFDRVALRGLADEIGGLDPSQTLSARDWFALETRFVETTVLCTTNIDLARHISSNRRALEACQSALFSMGLPPDTQSIIELGEVIELILSDDIAAAMDTLAAHLAKARDRTIAQLKITAVIEPPTDTPAYLQPA